MQIDYLKHNTKIIAMTLRLLFLILVLWLLPQPTHAAQPRTLVVELSFDTTAATDKLFKGYKLYQDSVLVCDKPVPPEATSITCEFVTEDGTHTYELAAQYYDGPDSRKSLPFQFTVGEIAGEPPPVGEPPPGSTGSKLISYSWETTAADITVSGYRMYMNDTALCETSDPAATTLACYADLINAPMAFSIASFDANGTESLKSNFLLLDPADFPELFQKKALTFTWEYTDEASSAGGFQIFNNGVLLCQTSDPAARTLVCEIDVIPTENTFTLSAVNALGELTTVSNAITYTQTSPTPVPPSPGELAAVISAAPTSGPSPLSTSFSAAGSTGDIATYNWDFGDGDKGSGSTTTHTYTIPGIYSASLEVIDALGNSALASTTIEAETVVTQPVPPVAVISSSTAAGETPLSVNFDGSASTTTNSMIVSYNWDFGDGSKATGPTTSHVYTVAGTYNAGLLVTDSLGLTNTASTPVVATPATTVNQEPVAAFSATPAQGPSPLVVSFDGSASNDPDGTIANYIWNFGDGSVGSGKTIQHTYTTVATYTATLSVTDDLGAISQAVGKTIIAEEPQPESILNYEIGELSLTHEWVRVNFENAFITPAVFVSPPTNNGAVPVLTRVRNLSKSGFDIRLQEWDYQDDIHDQETVSYLVLEQGQTTLPDGTMIEVGRFTGSTKKQTVALKQAFSTTPIVLTTVVSENEADAVIGRVSTTTKSTFAYLLQEQESTKTKHVNESVAYLAWSPGSGDIDNIRFSSVIPATTTTSNVTTIPFQEPFQAVPFFFAEQQTMNGGDTAALRLQKLTTDRVELFVQEEQSKDSEVNHIGETVGYLALTTISADTEALIRKITFSWEFDTNQESTIKSFRIYNNDQVVCESAIPSDRQITCETEMTMINLFKIVGVEQTGSETSPSNGLLYKP